MKRPITLFRSIPRFGFFVALLCLVFISCATQSLWLTRYKWTPDNLNSLPTQQDFPDAAAIILLDEAHLEVHKMNEFSITDMQRHTVIKILNERGYSYANVVIPYDINSNLYHIEARTILPDGTVIPLKEEQIFDTNLYPNFVFYSDIRAKRFTLPAVEDGCIVEYTWHKSINQFSFWTGWQFQKEDPVLVSRYTVRCPKEWKLNWKAYGTQIEPEVDDVLDGMKANRTWEMRNLPGYLPEISMEPGSPEIPRILFSPLGVENWNDIAQWYDNLSSDRMKANDEIRRQTQRLTEGLQTPEEKLEALFNFVRDRVRYIAIEIGIGSYQPHEAGQVLNNRYGDCKDMTTLLVAMAKAAGIDVYPTLISTWYNGRTDTSIISQAHFNHVIGMAKLADGKTIWMDPTEKRCPFGELPWYDQDRIVVSVERGLAHIERTPQYAANKNQSSRHWDIQVDSRGNASGTATMTFTGAQASELRRQMQAMHPARISAWFGRELLSLFPLVQYEDVQIENMDQYDEPLIILSRFSANRLMMQNGDLYSFHPGEFSAFDWHQLFSEPKRKFSIQLKHPLLISDSLEITYPENWLGISGVVDDSKANEFGNFYWKMEVLAPGKAIFNNRFELNATHILPEQYTDFRSFLSQIAVSNQRLVLFKSVDDSPILPEIKY